MQRMTRFQRLAHTQAATKFTLRGQIQTLRARYPKADPVSLIGSFLVLHEVTAFLPLLGLFGLLQQTDSNLAQRAVDWCARDSTGYLHNALIESERKIEKLGKRKGWFGYEKATEGLAENSTTENDTSSAEKTAVKATQATANAIAAYLVIKLLLPVRLAACFYLAPRFSNAIGGSARTVINRLGSRWMQKSK